MKVHGSAVGRAVACWALLCLTPEGGWTQGTERQVRIVRDRWGIAHVFADDERALFYGAGYAAAQDRLFQMTLGRRTVQGRLAEILGSDWVAWDRRMRVMGLQRHAEAVVPHLTPETRAALVAYADGVNAYIRARGERLSGLFGRYGGAPEPWRAADCVAQWMRISERFDRGWMSEVSALRAFEALAAEVGPEEALRRTGTRVLDESAAVVPETEMARFPEVYARLKAMRAGKPVEEAPKASHNWVVSGAKSTTGKPILESDPQIAVSAPSVWHEIHLSGGRYNVRGIGIAGAPGMLIGWNGRCAWGATALGSDTADLFQEQVDPGNPDRCRWLDGWERMESHTETIPVRGGSPVTVEVRRTRHGPVVNEFLGDVRKGEVFALHVLMTQELTSSLEGLLGMMRARDWASFQEGMRGYRAPGLHLIYADVDGNIGYWTMAAVPIRKRLPGLPHEGWTGQDEWRGLIPFEEMPHLFNPASGFISTANNLPVGAWYTYDLGIATGGGGDTARSWRLRELLSGAQELSPEEFLGVHRDAVSPVVRDFVRFALMVVAEEGAPNASVAAAAKALSQWGFRLVANSPEAAIANGVGEVLTRSLRGTPLADRYGGGEASVTYLLKDIGGAVAKTGRVPDDRNIRNWLLTYLQQGYERVARQAQAGLPNIHRMPYQNNLEGFGSLAPDFDLVSPPLTAPVVQTIWSQTGNSYTQIVDLSDVDASMSVLPPGISEDPASPHFADQIALWVAGDVHPAPLSREAVEKVKVSETTLDISPQATAQRADFDGSGWVDLSDFFLFASAFGRRQSDAEFNAKFDLDGDGEVGFGDFLEFAESFGEKVL
jgi:penicillin amidase